MRSLSIFQPLCCAFLSALLGGTHVTPTVPLTHSSSVRSTAPTCQNRSHHSPEFLVVGGGSNPYSTEIALEKNVLYFQRTLETLGYSRSRATSFFANGDDGQATVRYLDETGNYQLKAPEIPDLAGASTLDNLSAWFSQYSSQDGDRSFFFYFTGHGLPQTFLLWGQDELSVGQFVDFLDRLPQETTIVTMMAQCYSGSFADAIYEGGDRARPVALQTRCGFFATVGTRPSVGCTPEVNEADYQDYSSSFFAGLSGIDRTGNPVASADYNGDGRVSYAEAHAFAKVDEETMDWPVSTSEVWLQERASQADKDGFLNQAIASFLPKARPEQRYVVRELSAKFNLDLNRSYLDNLDQLDPAEINSDVQEAYLMRLGMELINIGMGDRIRHSNDAESIRIFNQLIDCESGFLKS
jgi:hypothetical protein